MLENVSSKSLEELIKIKIIPEFEFSKFSCHTQNVERIVKQDTKNSTKVCGEENRDGFKRKTFISRLVMPLFDYKKKKKLKQCANF